MYCVADCLVVLSVCFTSFPLFFSLIQFYEILAIQCDRCILVAQFELIRHLTGLFNFHPAGCHATLTSSPAKNCQGSRCTGLHGTSSRSRAVLTLQQPLAVADLVVVVVVVVVVI